MFKNFFRAFGIVCGIAAASSILVDVICVNTKKVQRLFDDADERRQNKKSEN